jgi:hypothetical protein
MILPGSRGNRLHHEGHEEHEGSPPLSSPASRRRMKEGNFVSFVLFVVKKFLGH